MKAFSRLIRRRVEGRKHSVRRPSAELRPIVTGSRREIPCEFIDLDALSTGPAPRPGRGAVEDR